MIGRKRVFAAIAAAVALLALDVACNSAASVEPGEYAAELNGQNIKVGKVGQAGSAYTMFWFDQGNWIPVTPPIKLLSKAELGKLVTGPVDNLAALQSKELTIIFVPKGWSQILLGHDGASNSEFKSNTGYVWISPLGFMNLKKL